MVPQIWGYPDLLDHLQLLLHKEQELRAVHGPQSCTIFELFQDIGEKYSLTESLKTFFGQEKLEGDNRYDCSQCKNSREARKRYSL